MEKKLITLGEASGLTPFDANYLGLLIRKKRLFGIKQKGKWYTTREAVKEYMSQNARREKVTEVYKRRISNTMLLSTVVAILLFVGVFSGFIFAEKPAITSVVKDDAYLVSSLEASAEDNNAFIVSENNQISRTASTSSKVLNR